MAKNSKQLSVNSEQRDNLLDELCSLLREQFAVKQMLREQQDKSLAEKEELFLELLELFDSLEFLVNYVTENPKLSPKQIKRLPKSLASVQKKLLNILERRQVKLINFQDSKPDFSVCQVVEREIRNDLEEQTITKIVRQGFLYDDKVLRAIEVITAKTGIF